MHKSLRFKNKQNKYYQNLFFLSLSLSSSSPSSQCFEDSLKKLKDGRVGEKQTSILNHLLLLLVAYVIWCWFEACFVLKYIQDVILFCLLFAALKTFFFNFSPFFHKWASSENTKKLRQK